MIQQALAMRWTIATAVIFGWLIAPSSHTLSDYIWSLYDARNPVVQYQGEIVKREGDRVLVHVWGRKLRDCEAVIGSVNSYSVRDGVLYGAHEARASGDSSSRPVGPVDLGTWWIWPMVDKATEIRMTVRHTCDGRSVLTEMARVSL